MVLLIDNYDSFTYNLVHCFETLGADVKVVRNDAAIPRGLMALSPKAAVISPGPSSPKNAGVCVDFIRECAGKIPVLEHRGAVLNLNDASLTYEGERIELTRNEFRILQTLLENKGKVVSRDTLMTKLWQMDSYVEENTLTVNVTRLRRKLERAGLVDFITTKVGSGYILEGKREGQ